MRLLLFLLFCCQFAAAQPGLTQTDSAFIRFTDSLPAAEPFDTARPWQRSSAIYIYLVSEMDVYDHFGYQTVSRYQHFDFTRYHILGIRECRYGHQEAAEQVPHRTACLYQWTWRIRENKKSFREIPVQVLPGHTDAVIPDNRKYFFGDTIIPRRSDPALTAWYTHAGGDCHATFRYRLLADKWFPVLMLLEQNYYGGCRAGGFWEFTISFKKPDDFRNYLKRTILMDKWPGPE